MLRPLVLVPALCTVAFAMEPAGTTPLLLQVGGDYLSSDLRKALQTDWGYHVGLATLVAESGMVGIPSLDLDVRYAPDGEGSFFSFEANYCERALVGDRIWLGAGVGSHFIRLKLDRTALRDESYEQHWGIGGKAMLGYLITDRLFVEATYHYTRSTLDLATTSGSLSLGYWF